MQQVMKSFFLVDLSSIQTHGLVKTTKTTLFGDPSPTILKSEVLKFGPVSEQGTETTLHKETVIFFDQLFHKY